ncbi:MAG: hypothetical protein QXP70_03260, partial [Methanomassiliicoccales archaeon]
MKILLLGLGNVGRGLLELMTASGTSDKLRLVGAADSSGYITGTLEPGTILELKRKGILSALPEWNCGTALEAVKKAEADTVIDCMPSNYTDCEPSYSCIIAALKNGMDVVTASKAALAFHMNKLVELARSEGQHLFFGGSVGGGTPFVDFGRLCVSGESDKVVSLKGVLNGTSNFVLENLARGKDISDAVETAKRMGVAEAYPETDLSGTDSAAKITILANSLCGASITMHDVIKDCDLVVAARDIAGGTNMRQVASFDSDTGAAAVRYLRVERGSELDVPGTENVLIYRCYVGGTFILRGKGAGGRETAVAILRDLAKLLRNGK